MLLRHCKGENEGEQVHLKGDDISEPPDDGHVDEGIALLCEPDGQQGRQLAQPKVASTLSRP